VWRESRLLRSVGGRLPAEPNRSHPPLWKNHTNPTGQSGEERRTAKTAGRPKKGEQNQTLREIGKTKKGWFSGNKKERIHG